MVEKINYTCDKRVPVTPYLLIFISLLFVPGVYLILLLSSIVPFILWYGLAISLNEYGSDSRSDYSLQSLVGFGAIISAYACLRGLWLTIFRKTRFELALSINLNREHKLDAFIKDICKILDTEPPDEVILLAEPNFYVQTGKIKIIDKVIKKKVLALGLPLLSVLSLDELRSIIVHEFAHFTGNDTLYSSFVLPVYIGTQETINRLRVEIKSKSEKWQENIFGFILKIPMYFPLGILYIYLKLFQLFDMKLSRIREKRADIIAVLVCGTKTFSNSLKKVIRISRTFTSISQNQIVDLLKNDQAYVNYYSVFRNSLSQIWNLSAKYESEALSEKQKLFSSHPTLKTRLQYLPDIRGNYNDNEIAISIFDNIDLYEETLTDHYTEHLSVLFRNDIRLHKKSYDSNKMKNSDKANESQKYSFICSENGEIRQVALVRCPKCLNTTYEGISCHICGSPLKSIYES